MSSIFAKRRRRFPVVVLQTCRAGSWKAIRSIRPMLQFTSPDGKLMAGSWTSTPGKWRAFTDKDECCHIVSGRCALISEDGKRWEFGPGASFMIPNGFRGYWEVIETTTKHFIVRQH